MHNALAALRASAAIPATMQDAHDIEASQGLTLHPLLDLQLPPGGRAKLLRGSRPRRSPDLKRTIIIAPSAEHIASLPGGKLPSSDDFHAMSDRDRITAWRKVVALGEVMGHELHSLLEGGRLGAVTQPLHVP